MSHIGLTSYEPLAITDIPALARLVEHFAKNRSYICYIQLPKLLCAGPFVVPARSKRAASANHTGGASAPPNRPDRRPRRISGLRPMLSAGCARSLRCDSGAVPRQNRRGWFSGGKGNF